VVEPARTSLSANKIDEGGSSSSSLQVSSQKITFKTTRPTTPPLPLPKAGLIPNIVPHLSSSAVDGQTRGASGKSFKKK